MNAYNFHEDYQYTRQIRTARVLSDNLGVVQKNRTWNQVESYETIQYVRAIFACLILTSASDHKSFQLRIRPLLCNCDIDAINNNYDFELNNSSSQYVLKKRGITVRILHTIIDYNKGCNYHSMLRISFSLYEKLSLSTICARDFVKKTQMQKLCDLYDLLSQSKTYIMFKNYICTDKLALIFEGDYGELNSQHPRLKYSFRISSNNMCNKLDECEILLQPHGIEFVNDKNVFVKLIPSRVGITMLISPLLFADHIDTKIFLY